jgi:hypothetical protein
MSTQRTTHCLRPLWATAFAFAALTLTALSYAYAPLNTDDAGTVGHKTNQIELYGSFTKEYGAAGEQIDPTSATVDYEGGGAVRAAPFTYTRGITDELDAFIGATYYGSPKGSFSSVTNYSFGLKWRFYGDGETGLNLALKPQVILPATNAQQNYGLGNAALNYGVIAIASYFWEKAELHANLAYLRAPYNTSQSVGFSNDPNRTNLYSVSIAPVWRVTPQFKLALDTGINTNPVVADQSLINYGMVAAIYSPAKTLDLGLSFQRYAANFGGVFSGSGTYTNRIQAGVTWRFD